MAAAQGLKLADVFLALGLDDKAYQEGLKRLEADADKSGKKVAASFSSQLKEAFRNPTKYSGDSIVANLVADVRAGIPLVKSLSTATSGLGGTLKSLSVDNLDKGFGKVRSTVKGLFGDIAKGFALGIGFTGFQAIGQGIGDLIGLIPSLIEKGKQYGLLVDEIGDSTGATAEQSSRLAGTLIYLGAPVGSITNLIGQMSRNLEGNEAALKAVGVATRDANGGLLNQVQILENARHAFQGYGDGTAKAGLISTTFARGGLRILVDYLKLTDEQAKKVTDDLQAQGLILTESQRSLAEAAQREGNRFQNALTGLGVALFTTVGPQISAFFSNLTEEIVAHSTEIANAISGAISFILGLVGALVGIGDGSDFFSASLKRGDAVASPYSTRILELSTRLADLKSKQTAAADSTDAQRTAIQRQIDVVDHEITQLKTLEAAQERTYKKALEGINAQLSAQERLLDAEDKAAQRAQTDLDLTERLRQAKIALFEAQAQLRKDVLEPDKDAAKQQSTVDQDTLDIADKQRAVLDAQKAIGEEARQRGNDDRRAELAGVKDYIASVAKLLDEADNKKAALNTLRRREAVLAARQQTQLAAGDTVGAGDTGLKLEAIRTAETRAQEEIRNGVRQTALEKQKSQLEDIKAAIKSVTVDANAEAIKQTQITLDATLKQQKAWDRLTTRQKDMLIGVSEQITGEGGLTAKIREAGAAGVEMGKKWRAALKGIADDIRGVIDLLNKIGTNKIFKVLFVDVGAAFEGTPKGGSQGPGRGGPPGPIHQDPLIKPIADWLIAFAHSLTGDTSFNTGKIPRRAAGGRAGSRGPELTWLGEKGDEEVLTHSLTAKLDRFFSSLQMPPLAAAAGPSGDGSPVIVRIPAPWTSTGFIDYIDENLRWRRRR